VVSGANLEVQISRRLAKRWLNEIDEDQSMMTLLEVGAFVVTQIRSLTEGE